MDFIQLFIKQNRYFFIRLTGGIVVYRKNLSQSVQLENE
jgi:hypothetical protein